MNSDLPMKRPRYLLRDLQRQLFYKAPGEWTSDAEQSWAFPEVQDVVTTCKGLEIAFAEVVEHKPGQQLHLALPLRNE